MQTTTKAAPVSAAPRSFMRVLLMSVCLPLVCLSAPAMASAPSKGHAKTVQHVAPAHHAPAHVPSRPAAKHSAAPRHAATREAARGKAHVAASSAHKHVVYKTSKVAYRTRNPGISCVPFARSVTGIDLKGNAVNWWSAAAGVYQRGADPEPGAILNFRATSRMRLGHVAVVSRVLDSRTVLIDHANWAGPGATKGQISKGIPIIDVSENNDWSAVRVGLGHSGDFGSVYPTYGFIYDRPDSGRMLANRLAPRGGSHREFAEAPLQSRPVDAVHRELR